VNKGALYSYAIKEKVTKKLIQQSSAVSNLQFLRRWSLFFEQNDNLMKFNTKTELYSYQILRLEKRLRKNQKQNHFKTQQRNFSSLLEIKRLVRNGTKRNQMKLNQIS
jgi:hypothetical protein